MAKILITTGIFPPEIGGPASYAKTLATHLSKDHKVSVLTYGKRRKNQNFPFPVVYVSRHWPKLLRHLIFFIKILSLAGKQNCIYTLNAVSVGVPSAWAARFFKKKFIVKIVGDYAWEIAFNTNKTSLLINDFQLTAKTGRIAILHKLQHSTCKKADLIIVPSDYLSQIVQDWGIPKEKIRVIYNGVDFHPSTLDKQEAKKHIGIAGNIILSVGRCVPWKGFKILIKIMPKLSDINQFFTLVIVGDGPEKKLLEMMVRNLGLSRKVYIVGKKSQEELAHYLAAADIFILNTGYEGFSHQVLEAMSAGVPVITTAVGGNKEIIHQGENGFMVKYNDEFNLVEAIKTVWQVPEVKERFIEEGRNTVQHFSLEKMIKETEEVLIDG